jgi:hypothetical protein
MVRTPGLLVLKLSVVVVVVSMPRSRVSQVVPVVVVDPLMLALAWEVRAYPVRVLPEVTQLVLDLATSPRVPVVVVLEVWERVFGTSSTGEVTVAQVHNPTFLESITSSVVVVVVAHTTGQPRGNAVAMVAPVVVAREAYWAPVEALPKVAAQH